MPLQKVDLNGYWECKEYPQSARRMRDLDEGNWLPAAVPSSIYTCLAESGHIELTDLEQNPEKYTWISEKAWVFRKIFDLPETIKTAEQIDLVCTGLDTVSHIWLNEKLIAKTDNMFITWRFNVTEHLRTGTNTLMIKFDPALEKAEQRMNRYGSLSKRIWGDPRRVYLRKAQYQFGSAENPSLPGCGIWQPIFLEAVQTARIKDIHIRTIECSQYYADLRISVSIEKVTPDRSQSLSCNVHITGGGLSLEKTLLFPPQESTHTSVIRIERPILWWPNGYGLPHLYTLTVCLKDRNQCLDERQVSFGVRTIHLRQEPDALGQSFEFIVNEQPIYIKGMHWMPLSLFPGNRLKETDEKTLARFQKTHGNMLRVWAGGFYESPAFYALCDKLGILIWQDFMFAEAYYPDRNWFLQAVKTEAQQVIQRLRNHPSIALWCGNSQCDHLHADGRLGSGRKFYGRTIYHKILPDLLKELDPDRPYIPTAPGDRASGLREQDVHPESISIENADNKNQSLRFCSGVGFRSLPAREILRACHSYPLNLYGKKQIPSLLQQCGDYFDPPRGLGELTIQSQVVQARRVKRFAEYLRARQHANFGWLVKTWSECWPTAGYSAVDYAGNPKAVCFYASRFMNPLLVTLLQDPVQIHPDAENPDPLQAVVLNDRAATLTATLHVRLMDLEGILLDQIRIPISLSPFKRSTPFPLPRNMTRPRNPGQVFLYLTLRNEEHTLAENTFFYLPDKWINWPGLSIDCLIEPQDLNIWNLSLTSRGLARDLSINPPLPANLSDNFFDLLPNQTREITIRFQKQAPSVPIPFCLFSVSSSARLFSKTF